jgi:uncharacterized protein (TIGR03437 family)
LLADSSAWTLVAVQDTGVHWSGATLAALSARGEIYSATGRTFSPASCPSPTLTLGDASQGSSCVTKIDASGHQVFAVQIGGADVQALGLDVAGDAYVAGEAGPTATGFTTTPGAYEANPPGIPDPFGCKLSGVDGHALYCTFLDVSPYGFAVDADGDAYVAGSCGPQLIQLCVEKLNGNGTALAYRVTLNDAGFSSPYPPYIAADASGNLFIAQWNFGVVKVGTAGGVGGTVTDLGNGVPVALAIDANGNPQVLLQDKANAGRLRLSRYSADLTASLFDTPFFVGSTPLLNDHGSALVGMAIDAQGNTVLLGGTYSINLPPVHPTQVCYSPAPLLTPNSARAFLARFDAAGDLQQSSYLNATSDFIQGDTIDFNSSGASVLHFGADWEVLGLGPAVSEIAMSCIGNGASFATGPLAPNEIVSIFGVAIGPAQPVAAQPDANGRYPFQLGGTQVTFDGVAAPLLYAGSGQINLVTPHSLDDESSTHVCVFVNQLSTNCSDMPVEPAAPGICSSGLSDIVYVPYAAALNQDGSVNAPDNPAPAGSIVSLFVTGLGTITPQPPDGGLTPYPPPTQDLNVRVTYGYSRTPPLNARTLYAGPAPLEVEGLGQINVAAPPPPESNLDAGPYIVISATSPDYQTQAYSPAVGIWVK